MEISAEMFERRLILLVRATTRERDRAWTKALGITDKILTPKEASEWLANDRQQRARNVCEASRPKGHPRHY